MYQVFHSTDIVRDFKLTFIRGSRSCSEDSGQEFKKEESSKLKLQRKFIRRRSL